MWFCCSVFVSSQMVLETKLHAGVVSPQKVMHFVEFYIVKNRK